MQRKVERRLKAAVIFAMLSGYLALATTFSYGTDILLVPLGAIALMPFGERLDRRFPLYRKATTLVIFLFIVIFFTVLQRFSLLDAVIALFMFIQVYSLVHVKSAKNYVHLFLMSFFLVLSAAVMSPRPDIAVVFVLFLVSTILGLTLLEMYTSGITTGATAQWRGASGEILSPRTVRIFDFRFSFIVLLIVAGMFAFAAAIFVAGPRTEVGVFGATRMPDQATTGLSSEVDLSQAGALSSSATPVMRVQFPDLRGGQFPGAMHWRVTALDAYTGGGWQHRGVLTKSYNTDEIRRFKSESMQASREGIDRSRFDWPLVNYEIYLDRPPETAVPLLQLPLMVKPGEESRQVIFKWDRANDFSVVLSSRNENGVYLEAVSELITPSMERLTNAPLDFSKAMVEGDLIQLTYHDLLPETRALVDQLTRGESTAYGKIMALMQYLQGSRFEYTRIIPQLPKTNPVDSFILDVRRGHCQLFASALALMVRSLGLPTRLVSGYRGGTWNDGDDSYTVTEDMAHVWTEVYFTGIGWVTFDPSPMDVEPDGFTVDRLTRIYNQYVMRARMLWLRNVVSFNRNRQGRELQENAASLIRSGLGTWDALQSRNKQVALNGRGLNGMVLVLFAGSGALVLFWTGFAFRGWANRRRVGVPLSPDQRRAVRLRGQTVRRLRRLGIDTDGYTAEELAVAAHALVVNDSTAIGDVFAVYNAARFGQQPFSKEDLDRWVQRVNRLSVSKPSAGG